MELEQYEIQSYEATECDLCGYPLFDGDIAYFDVDTSMVYCSKQCAKRDQPVLQDLKPYQDLL